MKHYKLLIISCFIFALSIGTVFAGEDLRVSADKYFANYCTNARQPLTGQRAFLCDIRMRLDKIENKTSTVVLTDAQDNTLGIFLGTIPSNESLIASYRLFIPSVDGWIPINYSNGQYSFYSQDAPNTATAYFSDQDCQGQAYIKHTDYPLFTSQIINPSAIDNSQTDQARYFKVTEPIQGLDTKLLRSKLYNSSCNNIGDFYSHAMKAKEVTLPFNLPAKTPLLIKAQ